MECTFNVMSPSIPANPVKHSYKGPSIPANPVKHSYKVLS